MRVEQDAVIGANGRRYVCGDGTERAARVRVENVAPCGAVSAALAQLAAALVGDALHLEEAVLAPRISSDSDAKKNHALSATGIWRRVVACSHAFAQLPFSIASAAIVAFEDGLRGKGGS